MSSEKLPKTELHAVTKIGIFEVQVCSLASEDDALAWVRGACPAGTRNNWQKTDEKKYRPVPCAETVGRIHYIFVA